MGPAANGHRKNNASVESVASSMFDPAEMVEIQPMMNLVEVRILLLYLYIYIRL